ncbi:MAG: hypothetical protein VKO39_05030 [Cyanobacteriota bacterium]|nr:hypothetical protein [Cyanobacteriota bacterium]
MSFDARSKERLEALGRTLPKKLPLPEPLSSPQASNARSGPRNPDPTGAGPRGVAVTDPGRMGPNAQRSRASGQDAPDAGPQRAGAAGKGSEGKEGRGAPAKRLARDTPRHRLEREQDPAALFRALISASPDGTVPPHLLDRMRELETPRPAAAIGQGAPVGAPSAAPARSSPNRLPLPAPRAQRKGSKSAAPGNRLGSRSAGQGCASEDQDLYTAFAQLLLEDDGD